MEAPYLLRNIIHLLLSLIALNEFVIFAKIKGHRSEPSNEIADASADNGRESESSIKSMMLSKP
jgi:ribonuclease HI